MKHFILSCALLMAAIATSSAQQTGKLPVYLDNTKPVEQRIDDAIARMTLQEKIRIIHAQSKFSSAGVPRLGFPDFGQMTVLMVFALMYCGTNGSRLVRPTTPALPSLPSPAWQHPGTHR